MSFQRRCKLSFKITFENGSIRPNVKTTVDSNLPPDVAEWQQECYKLLTEKMLKRTEDSVMQKPSPKYSKRRTSL